MAGHPRRAAVRCAVCWLALPFLALSGWFVVRGAEAEPPAGSRVLVTVEGAVFTGAVRQVPGGYRVDGAGSFVVFPFEKVRLTAGSLPEAYEALRDSLRLPTAEDHLLLAEWCLQNQLFEQAQNEVLAAMKLEPLRTDAREVLKQIDQRFQPPTSAPPSPPAPAAALPDQAFLAIDELTSAGLTRQTHARYMQVVQPLLLNKCGNANCHGKASQNAFRLQSAHAGTSAFRIASRENLQQALEYIDVHAPSRSPLLKKPGEPTPVHQKLFLGEVQGRQFAILQEWVEQAARERQAGRSTKRAPGRDNVVRAGGEAPGSPGVQPTAGERGRAEPVAAAPSLLERARQDSRPDAFDPDAFNRMMHGITAAERRAGRPLPAEIAPGGQPPSATPSSSR